MKKMLLSLLSISFLLTAAEWTVESPQKNLKTAFDSGRLAGKNCHDAVYGKKTLPDAWSYDKIEQGDTPETFRFTPLKALTPEHASVKAWKKTVLTSDVTGKKFKYPALVGSAFYTEGKACRGGAYRFRNTGKEKLSIILEGAFRITPGAKVFIYRRTANGTVTMLADDENPNAKFEITHKKANGAVAIRRNYLKLQAETELQPGDALEFSVIIKKPHSGSKAYSLFYTDDHWGKNYNPVVIIEDNEK